MEQVKVCSFRSRKTKSLFLYDGWILENSFKAKDLLKNLMLQHNQRLSAGILKSPTEANSNLIYLPPYLFFCGPLTRIGKCTFLFQLSVYVGSRLFRFHILSYNDAFVFLGPNFSHRSIMLVQFS